MKEIPKLSDDVYKALDNQEKYFNLMIGNVRVICNRTGKYRKERMDALELVIDDYVYRTEFNRHNQLCYEEKEFTYKNNTYHHLFLKEIKTVNTERNFENKLREIAISGHRPKLLLHSCCGPCSGYVISYLRSFFRITVLFYNPNIDTEAEFNLRLDEQRKVIESFGAEIPLIVTPYNHEVFLKAVSGHETEGEGSMRCFSCYRERLEFTAITAAGSYDYFTSTLSVSPYKNAGKLNEIGIELQKKYHVNYLYADFKKHEGYKKAVAFSRELGLYRQDYCGCEFSKEERERKNK